MGLRLTRKPALRRTLRLRRGGAGQRRPGACPGERLVDGGDLALFLEEPAGGLARRGGRRFVRPAGAAGQVGFGGARPGRPQRQRQAGGRGSPKQVAPVGRRRIRTGAAGRLC